MKHEWVVIVVLVAALAGVIHFAGSRDLERAKRRNSWFVENECKRTGYVARSGRPEPVYTCKGGTTYIYDDMPAPEK